MRPDLDMKDKKAVREYILERCAVWADADGGCWTWEGTTTKDGYGQFTARGKSGYYAHREMFKAHGLTIPDGRDWTLDHLCQRKSCVRPEHLAVCTRDENTRRARNAAWVRFMTENRAALNVMKKLDGTVIETV